MTTPIISIIIATYNVANTLPGCLHSISGLPAGAVQIIIQDAASTDGTIACVEAMQKTMPNVELFSEKDNGIYDAWNKTLPHVRGEWVLFLGADDALLPNALEPLFIFLQGVPEAIDLVAAPTVVVGAHNSFLDTLLPSKTPHKGLQTGMCFPHQGLLHRSRLFQQERFSSKFRIVGDYEFTCRVLTATNYTFYDLPFATMRLGGVSTNRNQALRMYEECADVARHYYGKRYSPMLVARIARTWLFIVLEKFLSEETVNTVADSIRALLGKTPVWSVPSVLTKARCPLPQQPLVSLLVATVGRTQPLIRLFASFAAQKYPNLQIVVADQNPEGTLDTIVASFEGKLEITVLRVENRGVSSARNALLPLAKGDIIAFPDDDCWYAPNALETVVSLWQQRPHALGMVTAWKATDQDESDCPQTVSAVTRYNAFKRGETYTQFYRKEALQGIEFDSELGPGTGLPYGCGEDTDFLLHVLETGAPVIRTSRVLVYHPEPNLADPALPKKVHAYALGRMHLLRKHKFPLWFKLANVAFPLLRLPLEGKKAWTYRTTMFMGRLKGLFHKQ